MISTLHQHKPCKNCPFRKDCMPGWLGSDRAEEIAMHNSFLCHEDNSRQCAGHMQVVDGNAFRQLAQRMETELALSGRELLFSSVAEFVEHHLRDKDAGNT